MRTCKEISDAELEAFLLTEEGKTAQQVDTTMGDFFTKQEKSTKPITQPEEEVIGPKKTAEPQNFNRFVYTSFEDKNNLKEIPTDAVAVNKFVDDKFTENYVSTIGFESLGLPKSDNSLFIKPTSKSALCIIKGSLSINLRSSSQ